MSSSNESGIYQDARYSESLGPLSPPVQGTNPFQNSGASPTSTSGGGTYYPVSRGDAGASESDVSSNNPNNNSTANLSVPLLGGAGSREPHQLRSRASSTDPSAGAGRPTTASSRNRMSRHIAPATAAANAAAFSSVSESMRFSQVSTVPQSAPSNDSHYAYPDPNTPEPDDWLHNPDPVKDRSGSGAFRDSTGSLFTLRGLMNMGVLILLALGLLMLFGGYPILDHFLKRPESTKGGFNLGGANSTGQMFGGMRGLIDPDTPKDVYERTSVDGKTKMKLVFSDEFETPGRSFYPGEDPFWESVDLHYWGTGDFEWYDPASVTTADGNLLISLVEHENHNLNFRSGMLSSWNKFCFTGGILEARVLLPGSHDIGGFWPGIWTMGNLGRAGYGATNDGMWPYSYDHCSVGTLPNQTYPAARGGGPIMAETTGDPGIRSLSYLPGQRLSRCTCPDSDDHPGPKHDDGSWVGRAAPELDLLEAAAGTKRGTRGHVSMSLQLAPFNAGYNLTTGDDATTLYSPRASVNEYRGGRYQQAASAKVITTEDVYADSPDARFEVYSLEYVPGEGPDAHVTWSIGGQPMWRLGPDAVAPDPRVEIGRRPIPEEPMYIIMNLGLSAGFTTINWDDITFPGEFRIDYVRVWQPEDQIDVGCNPDHHPTTDYIKKHIEAYTNPNLTTFTEPRERGGYAHKFPGNRLKGEC